MLSPTVTVFCDGAVVCTSGCGTGWVSTVGTSPTVGSTGCAGAACVSTAGCGSTANPSGRVDCSGAAGAVTSVCTVGCVSKTNPSGRAGCAAGAGAMLAASVVGTGAGKIGEASASAPVPNPSLAVFLLPFKISALVCTAVDAAVRGPAPIISPNTSPALISSPVIANAPASPAPSPATPIPPPPNAVATRVGLEAFFAPIASLVTTPPVSPSTTPITAARLAAFPKIPSIISGLFSSIKVTASGSCVSTPFSTRTSLSSCATDIANSVLAPIELPPANAPPGPPTIPPTVAPAIVGSIEGSDLKSACLVAGPGLLKNSESMGIQSFCPSTASAAGSVGISAIWSPNSPIF